MKRFAIVLAICMLLPLNAFALQPLSDDTMGQVTGQAGVSIAIDDVKLYQNIGYLSYTDANGTNGTAGTVSISNLYMMVNINAITGLDLNGLPVSPNRGVQGAYAATATPTTPYFDFTNTTGNNPYTPATETSYFTAKALTIDVGIMPVLSAGMSYNYGGATVNVAGVQIGLPTAEIHQTALTFDVTVSSTGAANSGAAYGTISIGANTMAVLDGVVEIAPHN
jgi:hypothetical protein